ncbi:F-box domain, cyclin-like protein [Tanacetum coccineum]
MILRSGKVLRHKDSSANNVDKISTLPDSLLIDILSLLAPSDVKQTRIVSKRWKNLFAFLPNLCLYVKYPSQVQNFHVFVDQTLAIRGDMPIEKLLLKGKLNKVGYNCLCDLLRTFVQIKAVVQELELRFPMFVYGKFCWDLFKTWDTLVGLTLQGGFVSNVPNDKLIFPCLKKLSLLSVSYQSCESVANLFYGCPVLEELSVENRGLYDLNVAEFKVYQGCD